MSYTEYKKQRLGENAIKTDTSNSTNSTGSYTEYKKQRLAQNTNTSTQSNPTFKTAEEALEYAKQNNIKVAGNTNVTPKVAMPTTTSNMSNDTSSINIDINSIKPKSTYAGDVLATDEIKWDKTSSTSSIDNLYNNVIYPMNDFHESVFYYTGKPIAKTIYKGSEILKDNPTYDVNTTSIIMNNQRLNDINKIIDYYENGTNEDGEKLAKLPAYKKYSLSDLKEIKSNLTSQNKEMQNFNDTRLQRAQEKTDKIFENFENNAGLTRISQTKAGQAGQIAGSTLGYLALTKAMGGTPLNYGIASGLQAFGNTNDAGDIAFETAKGYAYGKINSLVNNAISKGIEQIFPETNPLMGEGINIAGTLGKNAVAGAGGTYSATALTGEARNVYNKLRNREVTKEDWIKPVWSADTAISTLVGAGFGAISGTQADIKARAQYENDVNELVNKLNMYAKKFNNSIQMGDQQSALDIARASRDELVKFSMNKYGNRTPDTKVMNEVAEKWKNYLEQVTNYYTNTNNYTGVNYNQPALNASTTKALGASVLPKEINLNNTNSQNNVQNLQENTQNQSNIEQNSQNNVQNVSNLEHDFVDADNNTDSLKEKIKYLIDDNQDVYDSDIDEIVNQILKEEFKDADLDDDEVYDKYYERLEQLYVEIEKKLESQGYERNKNTYGYDDEAIYIPSSERLEQAKNDLNITWGKRPSNTLQFKQFDQIRENIGDIISDIETPENISISKTESNSSADATYIDVYNETTDETKTIRVANHYKEGVSGKADYNIDISDYNTIDELNKVIEKTILEAQKATENIQSGIEKILKNNYNDIAIGEVKNIPTKEMMPLYDGGGYRTEEQISGLKESIKKNGINTPIEIVKKPNGDYAIENGNHRLQIANELGIKEVPVKLVESWESIVARKMNEEVKNEYGSNTIAKTTNTSDENSGNSSGMLRNSDELFGNGRRATRDAGISTSKSDSNQQTSSLQNQRDNREKKKLKNSTQGSSLLPSIEELQTFDNKQAKEAYEKIHMINENDNELNAIRLKETPKYKTNLERDSGLIEQKIKDIEKGKTNRDDIFETTSKREIRKTIENQLGKKMLTKRFNTNKAYGIYKLNTDTIRLAEESDIETALHELGHQVDIKQLNNMTKQISNTDIRNELIKLCDNAFPNVYKNQRTKIKEGFAEATRNYIIEPQEFAQKYPHTSYLITEQLEKNPSLNSLFTTLQEKVHDYINMSPKDRVLSNVSINDENNKPKIDMKKFGQTFAKLFLDDNIALRNAVKKVAKSQGKKLSELSPNENALLLMKLQQGSQDATLMSLSEGYRNKNGEKVTKGLKQIVKDFTNEDIQNLIAYMVSEGNLDYIEANKQTGIRKNDAKAVLKEFKNTKIDKASKEIREINNYALTRLKDAGMLTEEQIKDMKKINEHYVPMNRVIEEDGSIKTGGNNMRVGNALKRRKGSDKTIINPLESTIVNNMRIDKQIEANEALKTLVNSLKKAGIAGEYFDTVPTPKAFNGTATLERFKEVLEEQGIDTADMDLSAVYNIYSPKLSDDKNMIMSYMENGKRKYIQFTDKELYKAINNLNSKQMSLFEQVLSKFNGVLRWGATTANISFAIPNFIADSQMAFLNSDSTYIPIVDSLVGIVDTISGSSEKAQKFLNLIAPDYAEKKKELYYKYKTSGASSEVNRSGLSRGKTRNLMEDVYGLNHKALFGKNKSAIQKGKEIFNLTTAPSDLSEEATRFRNFEKEYALYKKQGMPEDEALEKAGYNARRVTQDFSEAGQITRSINRLKPFTSARIGGVTQTFQNMAQNPKRFLKRLAILVAMDVAMYATNRIASKMLGKNKGKELEELQDQKMFDNYTFYIDDNNILTIKKIQGPVRSILNLSEMATDYALGNLDFDGVKKRLRGIFDDTKNDLLLVSDESDLVGQLATPLVENALNKDFYYGNDLINDNMKYLDNKDKYDENTSETAKILGKLLNYPPIYIDNLIEGYLAGVGTQSLKVSDSIINTIVGNKIVETPISEKFILSRFFADTNKNSQSVNEIYEQFEKLSNDKEYNRLTLEQEEMYDNVSNAKDYISVINKEIRETKNDKNLIGKEKRDKIDELMQLRTDTARYYLGKDVIDESNKEQIETFEYYPSSQTKISSLLDWEERGEYAQIVKDTYSSNLKELKDKSEYIEASEEEKKSQEKSALNKAKEKAKQTIVNDNIDDYLEDYGEEELAKIILDADLLKKYEKVDDEGIPLIDFYNAWLASKEAEGKKKAQKTAINEAVSDEITVQQRKSLYKILGVD